MKSWAVTVTALALLGAGTTPSAVERMKQLRQEARTAREAGDQPRRIRALAALAELMNHSSETVELQAVAYAAAGDTEPALAALQTFAAMGQSDDDIAKSDAFAKLRGLPDFRSVLEKMTANTTPVENAETAFTLSGDGLLAEDIDYDRTSKTFLLTSVLEKKIVRVDMRGHATDFAHSPSGWPMLAVKIDADHKRVWATEVALEGEGSLRKTTGENPLCSASIRRRANCCSASKRRVPRWATWCSPRRAILS